MQIPLNEFEQHIDEAILKRGLSYFENGRVDEPDEISAGVYEFKVEGSEVYTVTLHIKNEIVQDYSCDCPYDLGAVCKHVAAALFFLQQEILEIVPSSKKTTKVKTKTPPKKRKTVQEQVDEILQKLTLDEMCAFIHECTLRDSQFRKTFLMTFRSETSGETKKFYASQVKAILRSIGGKGKFIPWNKTALVWREVNNLLVNAQRLLEKGNFQSAFFIAAAVLEEMNEALQFVDDSNGDIGSCIEEAMSLLFQTANEELPEEIRKMIFDYGISTYNSKIFAGWDWHLPMLGLAISQQRTVAETSTLHSLLDQHQQNKYDREKLQELKLSLLRRTGTEKEIADFVSRNMSNPVFRRNAIDEAIKTKNYKEAIRLANEGIKADKESKPGLAAGWYDWLLKIALAQNDKEKIIEYARMLYLDHFMHEQDYYSILKTTVDKGEWNQFVEGLLDEITTKSRWLDVDRIADIYIKEAWWDRLLELLQNHPFLQRLERYEKLFPETYSEQIALLYETGIIQYLKDNVGRGHYKNACRYLRRMKKLGAGKRVEALIQRLKKDHPSRFALWEELERV